MRENVREAIKALSEKAITVTSLERIELVSELAKKYEGEPHPIRYGKVVKGLLEKASLPLLPYDLFVGRMSERVPSVEEEEFFQKFKSDGKNAYRFTLFSSGHATYDWENLIDKGLVGLADDTKKRLNEENDEEKRVFLRGVLLVLEGVTEFVLRYSKVASDMGKSELARVLENIASDKPRTFYEGLELCWIITFINCTYLSSNPTLSVGRLDKYLYPLYKKDVENGTLCKERAKELITDYYCKHNLNMGKGEHQIGNEQDSSTFDRILNFDSPQYLPVAGTDENGNGCVNELTELFVECIVPEFKNPVVVVRYYKGMDSEHPALWRAICDKALLSSPMLVYNDTTTINALMRYGIKEEHARDYEHFGCNWVGLGRRSHVMWMGPMSSEIFAQAGDESEPADFSYGKIRGLSTYGYPKAFMEICDYFASCGEPDSIDGFYAEFEKRFVEYLQKRLDYESVEFNARKKHGSAILTFRDCFDRDCVKEAKCCSAGGVEYMTSTLAMQGFGTTIDCFITMDKLVYRDKALSFRQLYEATKANFEGCGKIYALCKNVEKYGSGSELSKEHTNRFVSIISNNLNRLAPHCRSTYGYYLLPALQTDTWHIKYGEKVEATVDGRKTSEPFTQNSNPTNGSCRGGLAGKLDALSFVPFDRFVSGALSVDVSAREYDTDEKKQAFAIMIGEYFNRGGLQVQVSNISARELIDAQINPQNHEDLRVRVTGYSGIFVDIPKKLQDDIIKRVQ